MKQPTRLTSEVRAFRDTREEGLTISASAARG